MKELTKDPKIKELALVRDGMALAEMGNAEEAVKLLEELFKVYPKSAYTIDGSFYLSHAYTDLAAKEPDEQKRSALFNNAVKAMNKALTYEKTPAGRLRINLAVARMCVFRAKSEDQFKGKKGPEYKEKAIGGYQVILLDNPEKPELRDMIEDAYNECIPLLLDQGNWADVVENSDKYLSVFQNGKYAGDIRRWRNRARLNIPGADHSAPAEETPATTSETPETETPAPAAETPKDATAPTPPPASEAAAPAPAPVPTAVAKPTGTNTPPAAVQGGAPATLKPAATNAPAKPAAKPAAKSAATNAPAPATAPVAATTPSEESKDTRGAK